LNRKFLLRPGETMVIEHKIPIQKVDTAAWVARSSGQWFWLVTAGNANDTSVDTTVFNKYWNLSFAADFTT